MAEYEAAIEAIDEIPGIARRSAEVILAEIGLDMGRFPSAAHLCSWAGVCPGNYQSAGRRKHGKTTKENKALKTILTQCAKSAKNRKEFVFLCTVAANFCKTWQKSSHACSRPFHADRHIPHS